MNTSGIARKKGIYLYTWTIVKLLFRIAVQSRLLTIAPKSSYFLTSLSPEFGFISFSNIYQNSRYK